MLSFDPFPRKPLNALLIIKPPHGIPLRTLITPHRMDLVPLHPIHSTHVQRPYSPQRLHKCLLLRRQSVDHVRRRAKGDDEACYAASPAERELAEFAAKGVYGGGGFLSIRVAAASAAARVEGQGWQEVDLVFVWVDGDGGSLLGEKDISFCMVDRMIKLESRSRNTYPYTNAAVVFFDLDLGERWCLDGEGYGAALARSSVRLGVRASSQSLPFLCLKSCG